MIVVRLKAEGLGRVLNGEVGMTFPVDAFTQTRDALLIAHVRDYRYTNPGRTFQIWSLNPDGYEIVNLDEGDETNPTAAGLNLVLGMLGAAVDEAGRKGVAEAVLYAGFSRHGGSRHLFDAMMKTLQSSGKFTRTSDGWWMKK